MKLGEIKIEALKLMFVNYDEDIKIEMLQDLTRDENYGSYLVNMPGSINRCLSVIEAKCVLPVKTFELKKEDGTLNGIFTRFDLSKLLEDFYAVERIVFSSPCGEYVGDYDFQREGNTVVIRNFDEKCSYTVLYFSKVERVSALSDDNEEIGVPDNIARHIPYFIKGDLYRDDEPNEASEARNWFEAAMERLLDGKGGKGGKVNSVYSVYDLSEI